MWNGGIETCSSLVAVSSSYFGPAGDLYDGGDRRSCGHWAAVTAVDAGAGAEHRISRQRAASATARLSKGRS